MCSSNLFHLLCGQDSLIAQPCLQLGQSHEIELWWGVVGSDVPTSGLHCLPGCLFPTHGGLPDHTSKMILSQDGPSVP